MLVPPLTVETEAVDSTSKTAAVVEGSVMGAHPPSAEFRAAYALASSKWCESNGAEGSPEEHTLLEPVEHEEVQAELTGLKPDATYCVELEAREGGQSAYGGQLEFTAGAPSFGEELDAEATSASTAELYAEVELAGQSAEFRVLYGAAEKEWCKSAGVKGHADTETPWQKLSAEEASGEYVEAELADLTPGASYCARIALKNETAEARSAQEELVSGAPFADAVEAHAKTSEVEIVEGFISPASQPTSYWADYELASSSWCASGGAEGTPLKTSEKTAGSSEESLQPVSVEVGGLQAGERYCAALVARNTSASSRVLTPVEFTAGLASVVALEAVPISPEAAEVTATLYLTGQPASYELTHLKAGEPQCHPAQTPPVRTGAQRLARTRLPRRGVERAQRALSPTIPGAALALPFAEGELPSSEGEYTLKLETAELQPGSEYCLQLRVKNTSTPGETSREEAEENEAFFVAGAPTARTQEQVASTQTTALVKGEVQAAEQETSYWLQYGPASSQWCLTEGTAGKPQGDTEEVTLPAGSKEFEQVHVELTGLSASSEYCARFAAKNESGEAPPAQAANFTTRAPAIPPSASTAPVTKIGTSSATIEGAVNPGYTQTEYLAAYGLESSPWCASGGAPGSSPEHESIAATLAAEDAEAHTVKVEVSALSAATEYCAAIIANNSVGKSEPAATVSFTTASNSGSSQQEGQKGSGGVLGEEAHKEPEAKPQVGSQAVVGTVSGTVTVKLKGTNRYAPLGPGTLISDGSEIEATNGRVRLMVSLPDGKTQTAEALGGRFRIEQEANGFTKLVLTLALTGCPRQALPKGSASAASIQRNQPLHRHLWVTEKGGKWGTNGRFVSTSVEGTTWLTSDGCKRSTVFVEEGRLKVRNLLTKRTKLLTAGHSYTAKDPRTNHQRQHRR